MTRPTLIVLNGPSSAGKTTLARALQARWPRPLLLVSLDKVLAQLPFRFTGDGAEADEGHAVRHGADGKVEIVVGPLGRRADALCGESIRAWLAAGHDVVVDYVFVDARMAEDVLAPSRALDARTLRVALRCAPEVLRARELARGDRLPGLAEHLEGFVHDALEADLALDGTDARPGALADLVLERLGETPRPREA